MQVSGAFADCCPKGIFLSQFQGVWYMLVPGGLPIVVPSVFVYTQTFVRRFHRSVRLSLSQGCLFIPVPGAFVYSRSRGVCLLPFEGRLFIPFQRSFSRSRGDWLAPFYKFPRAVHLSSSLGRLFIPVSGAFVYSLPYGVCLSLSGGRSPIVVPRSFVNRSPRSAFYSCPKAVSGVFV